MPARSNDFQRLIFLIQKQLATSPLVSVTESKMLRDPRDGKSREVDVVVEFAQHGAPFVLAIECRDTSRKLTVEHVEQLTKKHEARSDKLIIVSRRGFAKSAAELASLNRVEAVTLEAATEVDWTAYVEKFDDLRLGMFTLHVDNCFIDYRRPADQSALLDLTKDCEFTNARGRASLRQYMNDLVQHDKVRLPVTEAWFSQPSSQRKEAFNFNFEYKPTEPLVIMQNGASFLVVAIRANVSAKVATGRLVLSPISFMKKNLLHGSATLSDSDGKPVQMVITQSADADVAEVSMLLPPKDTRGSYEVAKGRLRRRRPLE